MFFFFFTLDFTKKFNYLSLSIYIHGKLLNNIFLHMQCNLFIHLTFGIILSIDPLCRCYIPAFICCHSLFMYIWYPTFIVQNCTFICIEHSPFFKSYFQKIIDTVLSRYRGSAHNGHTEQQCQSSDQIAIKMRRGRRKKYPEARKRKRAFASPILSRWQMTSSKTRRGEVRTNSNLHWGHRERLMVVVALMIRRLSRSLCVRRMADVVQQQYCELYSGDH